MTGGRSSLAHLSRVAALHRPGARADQVHQIPLASIEPDPGQPRRDFAGAAPEPEAARRLEGLAANIRALGIEQPLRVRPHPEIAGRFILVSGERRYRAASAADLDTVPCLVDEPGAPDDEASLLVRQLSENGQREPLVLPDEARAVKCLVRELGISAADLARLLGRSKTWISNRLRLLESSSPETLDALRHGLLGDVETSRRFDTLPTPERRRLLTGARESNRPIRRAEIDRKRSSQMTPASPRTHSGDPDPPDGAPRDTKPPPTPRHGPRREESLSREARPRDPAASDPPAPASSPPAANAPATLRLDLTAGELGHLLRLLGQEPEANPRARLDQLYAALRDATGDRTA